VRALLGALVAAAALSACGDASGTDVGGARAAESTPACGWIPASAREATPVASLHPGSAGDPLCANVETALDGPKALISTIDRQLRESTRMSDAEENRIGAQLEAALPRERAFRGKLDLPDDVRRYGGYLRDLVQHLAANTTRPGIHWRVHLVHLPFFNAAALPGGTLLVFTGTLEGREAVHSEAELAAVLGHEMAHVERRHVVAAYQFARAALGEDTDEAVLAMRILTQPLSTEHELEADDRGTELAVLAQYDPQAVVDLWRRHAQAERRTLPARGPEGVIDEVLQGVDALLRSHPPAAVRACRAMDKLAWAREHATCDRVYDGRTNLRAHVAGPRRTY
jgi:hypothetical protein